MAGLPKIALARLRANAQTAKTPAHSSGSAGFQGAEHPDANLLAAFAEKSLTEQERKQLLNHLSLCADCREVAALIAPADTAMSVAALTAARRRWNPWPVLRWGALAAVLGTVTVVLLLHPGSWKRPMQISKATIPPAPAGKVTSLPQAVPAPLALRPRPPVPASAQKTSRERALVGAVNAYQQDKALQEPTARASARQHVGMMASGGGMYRSESRGSVHAERAYRGINAPSAQPPSASTFPAAPAAQPMAASGEAGKASAQSGAAPEKLPSMSESVEVTPAPPPPTVRENARLKSSAGLGGFSAARKKMAAVNVEPAALWNVSANGKVRRSTDGGKSFKHIRVGHGVRFRAIASLGNDVWAGGTGGTLFHSVDGGVTWTGTILNPGENAVTETLVGIQMRDVEHLTVTTDSGSKWFSEDGGHSWKNQP